MRVTIAARHMAVSPELRGRARELVDRLARLARRVHDAQVLFADDHGVPLVELRLHAGGGGVVVGRAEARDLRTALDRAAGRVRRQLDKRPGRRGPARRRTVAREDR